MLTRVKKQIKKREELWRTIGLLLLVFAVMSFVSEHFFTTRNIGVWLNSFSVYGIAALGMTFAIIAGYLDMATPSIIGLSAVVFVLSMEKLGLVGAALLALICCALAGSITGFLVAKFKLNAFVTSYAMQFAVKGVGLVISGSTTIPFNNPKLTMLITTKLFGFLPVTFLVFVAVMLVAQYILSRTTFGRNLYAIGGNKEAAQSVGINIEKHQVLVFAICGLFAGFAGLILTLRLSSGSAVQAETSIMEMIPMVILGGTSFSGGKGGAFQTLLGAMLMGLLFNAMSLFNVYANVQNIIKGLVLVIVIVSDKYLENKRHRV